MRQISTAHYPVSVEGCDYLPGYYVDAPPRSSWTPFDRFSRFLDDRCAIQHTVQSWRLLRTAIRLYCHREYSGSNALNDQWAKLQQAKYWKRVNRLYIMSNVPIDYYYYFFFLKISKLQVMNVGQETSCDHIQEVIQDTGIT